MNSELNSKFNSSQARDRVNSGALQDLVKNNADVNTVIGGNSLLHWAVINLEENILITLLDKGANIHAKNHDNFTPLEIAIQSNTANITSLLIERGALVDDDFHSLLNMAINEKNDQIVKMIIDHGLQDKPSVNLAKHFKVALFQGDSKILEAILPHCGFSKPSDIYIPREFVMDTFSLYENCLELLLKWYFIIGPDSYHDEDFIYAAFENGHLPIVINLLEHGIDVNMVSSNTGLNLLTISCMNKHHQIIEKLMEYKADTNVKIPSDNEVFDDNPIFDRHILEFNDLFESNDYEDDSIELTCLCIAVFNSDPITVNILLEHGAEIKDNTELFNLTCIAAKNGCIEIVKRFLELGVKVTDVNSHGETLLHFCLSASYDKQDASCNVAELLLEKGANILLQPRGNNYVLKAIENNNVKIAQLFLNHHADIQYVSPNGDTLLHKATKHCSDVEFIKNLLKLDVSVNVLNNVGHTPLLNACSQRSKDQLKIVKTLLRHKANVDYRSSCSLTPLMMATYDKHIPIIKILLNHQADLNAKDQYGQTCLHFACKSMSGETITIIMLLLKHGADIEAVDVDGRTPLFTALETGNNN
ncbi:putative ankyrin repeat protein RF_0381 isoform X2 [Chelonus insularis]|uniref:putative ankyrin repeat protein RF_0381 isoform X2 n=1 Tax=Chelonus insularis TaxID=460826 RepID=UPI00158E1485|nr:putative ankyrin repeat protein RF_0381 isoform X2 [Chelonus insularis]